jgi:hypothetical protein
MSSQRQSTLPFAPRALAHHWVARHPQRSPLVWEIEGAGMEEGPIFLAAPGHRIDPPLASEKWADSFTWVRMFLSGLGGAICSHQNGARGAIRVGLVGGWLACHAVGNAVGSLRMPWKRRQCSRSGSSSRYRTIVPQSRLCWSRSLPPSVVAGITVSPR